MSPSPPAKGYGSAVSSSSGIRVGAPAQIQFSAIFGLEMGTGGDSSELVSLTFQKVVVTVTSTFKSGDVHNKVALMLRPNSPI